MRVPARLAAAGASLVVVVGVAFAILGSGSNPVIDPIAQAATLSYSTSGYRMNLSMSISVPGLSAPVVESGNASVDLADQAASMTFAVDVSQMPQAAQQLGSTTMRMDMVLEHRVMYVRFPEGLGPSAAALDGKWIKIDLGKMTGLPGLSSLGSSPGMSDPSGVLQYLRAASNGVSNQGPEVVDGVSTTHYSAMLSLDQLSANVPAADQAAAQRALSQLEQATGMHAFPINVWIDAHHLVRRLAMSFSMHAPGGAPMQEDMTADFTDYGPQPRPVPPPADQITDLSSLVHIAN